MLTLDEVRLSQGAFRLAADWQAGPGLTAIIGPSGGGKSTLLAAIAGFLPPVAGRMLWQGKDLSQLAPGKRPVSVLFQDNNLFPHLTIRQNVGLGLRPDLRLAKAQWQAVDRVLADVGLADLGGRKPAALSGGQQSRAALARVLLADRPVVLLDEPFAALGPGQRTEMMALVQRMLAGRTILMVTHDPSDARSVADQVVLVAEGMAAAPVVTSTIFDDPPAALKTYLGAVG